MQNESEANNKARQKMKMYKYLFITMLVASAWVFFTIVLGYKYFHFTKLIAYLFMFVVFIGFGVFYRKQYLKFKKQ